jgi:galactokinase
MEVRRIVISARLKHLLESRGTRDIFRDLYGSREGMMVYQVDRYTRLTDRHARIYGSADSVRYFSAPGRIEIVGNHTDHNHGRVLAAAISLDTVAAVSPNSTDKVRLSSEYDHKTISLEIDLRELSMRESERNTAAAIVRGALARMAERGVPLGGFDVTVTSDVHGGSGLSSSAAFEVMMLAAIDGLFAGGALDPGELARIAQNVENTYFGKPSGLMDQTASSVGGLVTIDFRGNPAIVEPIQLMRGSAPPPQTRWGAASHSYDFTKTGYAVVVVNPGGDHSDLSDMYGLIPKEMKEVAAFFGEDTLRLVRPEQVEAAIGALRLRVSDRAILRALHFFDENDRVAEAVDALAHDDLPRFLRQVTLSGDSSWRLLQNVIARDDRQPLALALEMAKRFLFSGGFATDTPELNGATPHTRSDQGACRVHGGGFEGTILCFVPNGRLTAFIDNMNAAFGDKSCVALDVRRIGATEIHL